MSNTRDSFGEQATLDGLIAHTLTSLEEDGVTNLPQYALYKNTGLTNVIFPNLLNLSTSSLQDCTRLTTVDIGGQCTISAPFSGCSNMDTLILRNTDNICSLNYFNSLEGSKIATGFGGVFVPDTLLSAYKSATNWNTMAENIFPLSEYPRSHFDTIGDNWDTIIANCNTGTIDNYNIGDTKLLNVNGTQIFMQIIAKNTDKLTNNTGTASLTWLCKDIYGAHSMNNQNNNTGGWEASIMRSWLRETILAYFPIELQNGIKEVKKTWYDYATQTTQISNDTIWIPSTYEMFAADSTSLNSVIETGENNVSYSIFSTRTKRPKKYKNSLSTYWLRSANKNYPSSYPFYTVESSGYLSYTNAAGQNGVVFGFCT